MTQLAPALFATVLGLSACFLAACGDDSDASAGTGGAGSGGTPATGGTSATGGTPGTGGADAGPCEPYGSWHVTYAAGDEMCSPPSHDIVVAEGEAGQVLVTVVGDGPQQDTCTNPPSQGTYSVTGTLSSDGCQLEIVSSSTWCTSGESQCESFDLSLTFSGSSASGTIDYKQCWCGGVSPPKKPFPASAQKS